MGTITKALNLLNYLSESSPELGLMDFKKLSGQDKATVHRHLVELATNGYLEQNPKSRKYRLGSALLRLAAVRERTFPTRRIVAARVNELSESCGELVHAMLIGAKGMSPLYYCDAGVGGTRVYFDEADVLPLHATSSGLAALTFGDPEIRKRILSKELRHYTDKTATSSEQLEKMIEKCRELGYAFTNETFEDEVSSVAVPFFENGPFAYGTLAVAIPTSRLSKLDIKALAEQLWKTSDAITRELGGRTPEEFIEARKTAA